VSIDYYQLIDVSTPKRWYLQGLWDKSGTKLDPREFQHGKSIPLTPTMSVLSDNGDHVNVQFPLRIGIRKNGQPLDFTFSSFDMPVINGKLAHLLLEIDESAFQVFPVSIDGVKNDYFILNVVQRLNSLDRKLSDFECWTEVDGRPEKVGKPRAVYKLVIDRETAQAHHAFRVEGWEIALIVSSTIKQAFEDLKVTGVDFEKV
jgi:hypothetical protein